jgi:FlaG protein
MSFEIGPTPPSRPASTPPARASASFQAKLAAARPAAPVDRVDVGVPGAPPAQVLDAVGVAADRVDALAAANRELHFERDPDTGRVIVQVRDLASGEVLRTIPPSRALDVLSGGAL